MRKKQFKRLGIIGLSCLLAISTVITPLANVNGTGGGEVSTDSKIDWIGNFWKLHINQGVRFTIVNTEGVAVSNPVDMVAYFPENVAGALGLSDEDVAMLWNDYKDNTGKRFGTYKKYIVYLGGCKTDTKYVFSRNLFDMSVATEKQKEDDKRWNGVYGIQRDEYVQNGFATKYVDGRMYTYSMIEALLNKDAEKFGYENPINGTEGKTSYISANGEEKVISRRFQNPVQERLTSSGVVSLAGTGEEMKNQLMAPVTVNGETQTLVRRLLEMDAFDMDGRGKVKSLDAVKMFTYIDPELNAQYESLIGNDAVDAMSEVFMQNNLRLLIEDVHWCVPYVVSPLDPYGNTGTMYEAAWCADTVVYGTTTQAIYYTLEKFNQAMKAKGNYLNMPGYNNDFEGFCKWIKDYGIGIDWNWDLGDEAYMLASDALDLGLKKYDPETQDSLSELLQNYNTIGYGVMVTRLEEEPTGTSTFDELVYGPDTSEGYRRGPAEEKLDQGGSEQQNNIVKFYAEKTASGDYIYIDNNYRNQTVSPVQIENEINYRMDDWFTSEEYKQPVNKDESYSEYKKDLENKETGTNLGVVVLEPSETLYVRLVEEKGDELIVKDTYDSGLVLHENEISHNFGLEEISGSLLSTSRFYESVDAPECGHTDTCDCTDSENCTGHECGVGMSETDADTYSFKLHNSYDYNKQFVWKWVESNTEYSGDGGGSAGFEVAASPDMDMVISRSFEDKPTLYPGLNSTETKGFLVDMGITAEGYQPETTRFGNKTDQEERVSWTGDLKTDWQYQNIEDPEIAFAHSDHGTSDTEDQESAGDTSELNNGYSADGNVTVHGLWGKANQGLESPSDRVRENVWNVSGLKFISVKAHVDDEDQIKFYPYYKMVYQDLGTENKDVYLTSENLSKLLNVQRVDTAMLRTGAERGLELQSYQWQIHRSIQNGLNGYGITDRDSVLPAGAIYQLRTGNSSEEASDTWVGMRIFSTYVGNKNALVEIEGVLDKEEAQSKIAEFKGQVERVLEGYEIVMHGAEGIHVDEDGFYEESEQLTGKVGTYQIGGQRFNSDSKYDLKTGGDGADRSDLDVLDIKSEQYDWKIVSDVDGNISVYKNDSLLEVIKKGSGSFGNPEVVDFNERTELVTNYINAVDRNLGSDRSGQSWYNEAFEIHCIEDRAAFKLGFGGGQDIRSAALNIKAGGRLESRADLYNMDRSTINDKARTYKFYTSMRSNSIEAAGHGNGWVGNYGDMEVVVPGIHGLLTSKLFYSSNGTVADLN